MDGTFAGDGPPNERSKLTRAFRFFRQFTSSTNCGRSEFKPAPEIHQIVILLKYLVNDPLLVVLAADAEVQETP